MVDYDVVVIGGGLAGLTAAIDLSLKDHSVLLIEKNHYPIHKVCGEYLSKEVVPYLTTLGVELNDAVHIDRLQLSSNKGKSLFTKLPLGGIGISRFSLDYRMYARAKETGVNFLFDLVNEITFAEDIFQIRTVGNKSYSANLAIGAFGKRSSVDKMLGRSFIQTKAPWLGVKAHYQFNDHPSDLVGVHAFKGGYGGISKTESGVVNFCYLAHYDIFKKFGNIDTFNQEVVAKNPFLNELLSKGKLIFDKPLTIAQISFQNKQQIVEHMLLCGDAAGLIHPLCGNGMAMAIHSAQIAADLVSKFLSNINYKRTMMENEYREQWNLNFSQRLWWGRRLQSLLLNQTLSNTIFGLFSGSRTLTYSVIKRTHGKILEVS